MATDIHADAIINAVFTDPTLMHDFRELPSVAMPTDRTRAVWATMLAMHRDGIVCDLTGVISRLSESDNAAASLGPDWADWLMGLCNGQLLSVMPRKLAGELIEAHWARELRQKLEYLLAHCPNNAREIQRHLIELATPETMESEVLSIGELVQRHPALRPPVVDGLIRQGETCNLISKSKVGKSWMVYGLALSVVSGRPWLDRFPTARGSVLLVDNELHPEVLASRIPAVAEAMEIQPEEYRDRLKVLPLRGRLQSFQKLRATLAHHNRGDIRLVIVDAMYRMIPDGTDENSNGAMTSIYNAIDEFAGRTGSAVVLIHHASKGSQSDKDVTDVGSGAGAQSRAADAHLVLRPHREEGAAVLDAALRSFAPIEPLALRWEFPVWVPAEDLDPEDLKRAPTKGDQQQEQRDREGYDGIVTALQEGPATERQLRKATGMGAHRLGKLIHQMLTDGRLTGCDITAGGRQTVEYRLANHITSNKRFSGTNHI